VTAKIAGWKKGEGINFVQAKKIMAEAAHTLAAEVQKNQARAFLKQMKMFLCKNASLKKYEDKL
jgi:hypothetical protein